jgi:NAD(P)-dependent dehydrogenase (short-subunit alcohol dehydrogenase family)
LRDTGVKVNSYCPGYTATDLNQHRGTQNLEQPAAEAVRLRFQTNDGPPSLVRKNVAGGILRLSKDSEIFSALRGTRRPVDSV